MTERKLLILCCKGYTVFFPLLKDTDKDYESILIKQKKC